VAFVTSQRQPRQSPWSAAANDEDQINSAKSSYVCSSGRSFVIVIFLVTVVRIIVLIR